MYKTKKKNLFVILIDILESTKAIISEKYKQNKTWSNYVMNYFKMLSRGSNIHLSAI